MKVNVARIVNRLKSTEQLLLDRLNAGSLKIVGAYYNLQTGAVDFFEQAAGVWREGNFMLPLYVDRR